MTDDLHAWVAASALELPEVEADGDAAWSVAGTRFVELRGDVVQVRGEDGGWRELSMDLDRAAIDDAVARAWEVSAPSRLHETGGR